MNNSHVLLIGLICGLFFYLRWKTALGFRVWGWPAPDQGEWKWQLVWTLGRAAALFYALVFVITEPAVVGDFIFSAFALMFPVGDALSQLTRGDQLLICWGLLAISFAILVSSAVSDLRRGARNRGPDGETQTEGVAKGMMTGMLAMAFASWPLWAFWLWSVIRPFLFEPREPQPYPGPTFIETP